MNFSKAIMIYDYEVEDDEKEKEKKTYNDDISTGLQEFTLNLF